MRQPMGFVLVALAFAVGVQAQQKTQEPPLLRPPATVTPTEPLEIWQIDLNPSGTGFALTRPVDMGDVYVFKVWPDRATIRLPKTRVKKMVARTKDVSNEVLYQIDLVPTGQMYCRDVPIQKGGTYQFHSYRGGTLMSVRQADVRQVAKVTGLDAFKIHLQQYGAAAVGNLPMQGGGNVTVLSEAPNPPSPSQSQGPFDQGTSQLPANWIYAGFPGVTEAWAPPSAVVSAPGEPPKAAEPKPHN